MKLDANNAIAKAKFEAITNPRNMFKICEGFGERLWQVLGSLIVGALWVIESVIVGIIGAIWGFVWEVITWVFDFGKLLFQLSASIWDWLQNTGFPIIGQWFSSMWEKVKEFFGKWDFVGIWNGFIEDIKSIFSWETLNNIAIMAMEGFKNGLVEKISGATSVFTGFISKITGSDVFDIGSPSKVFKKIGSFVMQGFNNGLTGEEGDTSTFSSLTNKISELISGLTTSLTDTWTSFKDLFKSIWDGILELLKANVYEW